LLRIAAERNIGAVAYGAIVDDLGDHRPGMEAARRMGILAPLLDSDICKNDVRKLAEMYNLHVHDKPSSPCLASRIPIGTEVTTERLLQIEAAESALRALGFREFRVRHHGDIARVELGAGEIDRIVDAELRASIVRSIKDEGFAFVVVDLEGYRAAGGRPGAMKLYSIGPSRESGQ
jgi:uncharacterized protein